MFKNGEDMQTSIEKWGSHGAANSMLPDLAVDMPDMLDMPDITHDELMSELGMEQSQMQDFWGMFSNIIGEMPVALARELSLTDGEFEALVSETNPSLFPATAIEIPVLEPIDLGVLEQLILLSYFFRKNISRKAKAEEIIKNASNLSVGELSPLLKWGQDITTDNGLIINDFIRRQIITLILRFNNKILMKSMLTEGSVRKYFESNNDRTKEAKIRLFIVSKDKEAIEILLGLKEGLGKFYEEKLKFLLDKFTKEQIIKVLSHDGGSNNLEALLKLFTHVAGEAKSPFDKLIEIGFTVEQIIKVLSHGGGAKNLESLVSIIPHLIGFKDSQDEKLPEYVITPLVSLGNRNSRSANINFLTSALKVKDVEEYILTNPEELLLKFCTALAKESAKSLKDKPANLETVTSMISAVKRAVKRKADAGAGGARKKIKTAPVADARADSSQDGPSSTVDTRKRKANNRAGGARKKIKTALVAADAVSAASIFSAPSTRYSASSMLQDFDDNASWKKT